MQISINLNKDFERALESLRSKYSEDFEYINGVHPSQLDYTEFLANFEKSDTLADATIDPNANANHRDAKSFITEKSKPYDKLFGLSKIFYEIKKRWGIRTSREWLEQEYSKGFYLNDASTASFFPYCYKGEGMVTVKYRDQILNLSFAALYDLVQEPEIFDESIQQVAKFPEELFVLDLVDGVEQYSKVVRVVKHFNNLPMRVLKLSNGLSQIVTANHPVITSRGDVEAADVVTGDVVVTVAPSYFDGSIGELFGLTLTSDLGWLAGMFLAEGYDSCGNVMLVQDFEKSSVNCQRVGAILDALGAEYSTYAPNKIYLRRNSAVYDLIKYLLGGHKASTKQLPADYIHYSKNFLKGFVAGLLDGDGFTVGVGGREWSLRSTSEILIHQLSNILASFGLISRDILPQVGRGIGVTHLPVYGTSFRFCNAGCGSDFFADFDCLKFQQRLVPPTRRLSQSSSLNKRYSVDYGKTTMLGNEVFVDACEEVYDITTETGHFLCNNILSHNCWANDLTRLATEGLFFLPNYNNLPPSHLDSFLDMLIEFVSFLGNRQSGAVGLPNLIIWIWYFWQNDVKNDHSFGDPNTYLRQFFQKLIYRLNQPFLRIDQTAFTNVSIFDRPYLTELFGGVEFPDGTFAFDHIEDLIECQKVFMEVVSDIRNENMFTFPVLTYSLLYKDGKFEDEDFARWCSDHNVQWMDSNFFVSDNVGTLSNCCRLLSDTTKLDAFINSIGGTALSIGSCRVSTINLVRIAYEALEFNKPGEVPLAKAKQKYIKILRDRVELDCKALLSMRHIIKRNIEKGFLPNYQDGAVELDKQYCTIGGIGMYEVMDLFGLINTDEFGSKSYSDEAVEFATEILDNINAVKDTFFDKNEIPQEERFSFNVEMIPAENCAGVICNADNLLYEQNKYFIYSNQWIPLMETCSIKEKCRLGNLFDKKCGGGCIAHINVENRFANKDMAWEMLNYVASQGVIYFAFTGKINVCRHKHSSIGTTVCPVCGEPIVDTYSRVVGFYTPTSSYQKIRKREWSARKWYRFDDSIRS